MESNGARLTSALLVRKALALTARGAAPSSSGVAAIDLRRIVPMEA